MESVQTTLARNVQGKECSAWLYECADALVGRRLGRASWKQEQVSHIFRKGYGVDRALEEAGYTMHTTNLGVYLGAMQVPCLPCAGVLCKEATEDSWGVLRGCNERGQIKEFEILMQEMMSCQV